MDDKAKETASRQLDLQDFNGSEVKQYLEDLFKGRRVGEVKQPDNSIELSSEEFDRFNQDTKQWILDNIISKNQNYTYLGILEVKNGNFQAFQKENIAFSVNPVIKLSGIILKYYLVIKVIPNKIRNKIKKEQIKMMKNTITEPEKQKIDEFEASLKKHPNWSFSNVSGGFVNVEIAEHNEKSIFLTVKSGVKSDCENRVYEDYFELVRDTLAIYETN